MSQIIESTTTASTSRSDSIMWATTLASILCHYCGDMYSIILPIATFAEGLVKDVNFSQKGLGTGTMSLVLRGYLSVIQRLGTSCADILRYVYISPPPQFFLRCCIFENLTPPQNPWYRNNTRNHALL